MDAIAQTFAEFGHSIGIDDLEAGTDGGLTLSLESDRELAFQIFGGGVLMLLIAPVPFGSGLVVKRRALQLCHWRHGWPLPVLAGLSRDRRLLLGVRLRERDFQLPLIEQAFDLLVRLHRQAQP